MFVAYLVFFTGIEQVSNVISCGIITIVLHYTFLTSFLWMGVYSNRIYNSLVKVRTYNINNCLVDKDQMNMYYNRRLLNYRVFISSLRGLNFVTIYFSQT